MVKVDLGIQIDGFIAMAGHTLFVEEPAQEGEGEEKEEKEERAQVSGR